MLIALFKAIPFGIFMTVIIGLFVGSAGSTGGSLHIRSVDVDINALNLDFRMYWSWILFVAGTGLAWAILFMMGD